MNNYLRVGIYLRLSKEDKDKLNKEDDSESIKNQRHLLYDYISHHNNFILVDEYCDEDLSGAGTYRPEFNRLINDCENKKIDIVLCKSQSRFSRDMEIIEKYLHNKFNEWHIRFISLADNADTFNLGNKKARQINGLVNEWYLEDISNNIRSAFNSKMKQGELISPFAPFGYDINPLDNNKLIIDSPASLIVKDIFNLYLKGYSFTKIANYLNKQNIPSPSYYKYLKGIKLNIVSSKKREDIIWSNNAIKNILTNEVYIGNLIQGKRTTISYKNHKVIKKEPHTWLKSLNTHEPIISKDIFNKVQSIIKTKSKPLKKTGLLNPFSHKVYCLECHHLMRKKNSSLHEYLYCPNPLCSNPSIRYDTLSNLILNHLNSLIKNYYKEELFHNYLNKLNKDHNLIKEQKELETKIKHNQNIFITLYEDKLNNLITPLEYKKLLSTYQKQNIIYKKELKQIKNKLLAKENISFNQFTNLNKIITDEFITKIYIGKINKQNREIKIIWNI